MHRWEDSNSDLSKGKYDNRCLELISNDLNNCNNFENNFSANPVENNHNDKDFDSYPTSGTYIEPKEVMDTSEIGNNNENPYKIINVPKKVSNASSCKRPICKCIPAERCGDFTHHANAQPKGANSNIWIGKKEKSYFSAKGTFRECNLEKV